jgi:hypothetical protein
MDASNWTLNSYTVATWTDLVAATGPTVIKSLAISVGTNAANAKIRLTNSSGTSRASIVPASTLAASTGYTADIGAITLGTGDKIQVQVDVTGVEFSAFGAA